MTHPIRPRRPAPAAAARVLAFVAGLALLLGACSTGKPKQKDPAPTTTAAATATSSAPPPPPIIVGPIDFTDCTEQFTKGLPRSSADRVSRLSISCGRQDVPIDYNSPYGTQIRLYVVRVHDMNQSNYEGSLLVNPGGPGASGAQLAVNMSLQVSLDVLDHYDIVGFDPRGVFLSGGLQCITDQQKDGMVGADPDVRTPDGLAAAKAVFAPIGPACAQAYGSALQFYNTDYTARDMDLVRQGVGDDKLNFLGYSYGTLLGAVYAHLFPAYVGQVVLDGGVDPTLAVAARTEAQVAGFEQAFDQFAADCLKRPECQAIGPPRAAVTALVAAANQTPIPTSRAGDKRLASGGWVLSGVAAALYDEADWTKLGNAILSAQRDDASGLFALADTLYARGDDGAYSNLLDVYTTVECNDEAVPVTDAQVQALATDWAAKYPLFGLNQAVTLLTCSSWAVPRHPIPAVDATTAGPILVIGTVHDPATPYAGAGALAKVLGSGVLLTWDGQGHTAYPQTTCIRDAVDRYLIQDQVPATDTSCPAK